MRRMLLALVLAACGAAEPVYECHAHGQVTTVKPITFCHTCDHHQIAPGEEQCDVVTCTGRDCTCYDTRQVEKKQVDEPKECNTCCLTCRAGKVPCGDECVEASVRCEVVPGCACGRVEVAAP